MKGVGTIGVTDVGAASLGLTGCHSDDDDFDTDAGETVSFDHGVASGDPLSNRVILWTRVTPRKTGSQKFTVKWLLSRNQQMTDVIKQGEVITSAVKDYTVKVDVDSLQPNTVYYYQFAVGKKVSRVGRTRPYPSVKSIKLKWLFLAVPIIQQGFFMLMRMLLSVMI